MIKFIKNLISGIKRKLTKSAVIPSITYGERDKDGFVDIYVNGKNTNVRLLLGDREHVERLQKIVKEIHKKNIGK